MVGKKFDRLTVIKVARRTGKVHWLCKCSCGNTATATSGDLTGKHVRSCGCWRKDHPNITTYKHGQSGNNRTPTYRSWQGMHHRCENPKAVGYKDYGGRGIKVCKRWSAFENFFADMGTRPKGKTIERVNNSKGYSTSNCTWATPKEQYHNRRTYRGKRNLVLNGQSKSLSEWCELYNVKFNTVYGRMKLHGWELKRALTQPVRGTSK